MSAQGPQGIDRIFKAFGFSMKGFRAAYVNEAAFRQETWLASILIPLGLWLGPTPLDKAILVAVILLVLMVELLNSGIETIVDWVSTDHHELAGRAKDIGSAAVFLSLINVLIVWGLVLLPRYLN